MKVFALLLLLFVFAEASTETEEKENVEDEKVRSARELRLIPNGANVPQEQWPSYNVIDPYGPGTYAFGFSVEDPITNNIQFKDEERLPDGTIRGRYGFVLPNGEATVNQYVGDDQGFRTTIERIRAVPGPFIAVAPAPPAVFVTPAPIVSITPSSSKITQQQPLSSTPIIISSTPLPPVIAATPRPPVTIVSDIRQYPPPPPTQNAPPFGGFFQNFATTLQGVRPTGFFGPLLSGFQNSYNQGSQGAQGPQGPQNPQRPGFFQNLFQNAPWNQNQNQNNNNNASPFEEYPDYNDLNDSVLPYSGYVFTNPYTKESGWFKRFLERRKWNQLLRRADHVVAITPAPAVIVNKK